MILTSGTEAQHKVPQKVIQEMMVPSSALLTNRTFPPKLLMALTRRQIDNLRARTATKMERSREAYLIELRTVMFRKGVLEQPIPLQRGARPFLQAWPELTLGKVVVPDQTISFAATLQVEWARNAADKVCNDPSCMYGFRLST